MNPLKTHAQKLLIKVVLPYTMKLLTMISLTLIMFGAGLAFAQTAAVDAGTPSDTDVVMQGAQTIIHTAQDPTSPKYLIVIAAVFVLCQLFKRFGHRIPALGPWLLAHPWGDWIVGTVLAVSGALMTSIPAGKGFDLGLIMSALVTGMAASGTPLSIFGNAPTQSAPPDNGKAEAAGAAGAADPSKTLNS